MTMPHLQLENVHPINEAKGHKIMLEKNENMTTADLAARFGKSGNLDTSGSQNQRPDQGVKEGFPGDKMLLGHQQFDLGRK